jgi:ElaB/YqjD/DUF883 family membrane-anchored ribosome-binding protein
VRAEFERLLDKELSDSRWAEIRDVLTEMRSGLIRAQGEVARFGGELETLRAVASVAFEGMGDLFVNQTRNRMGETIKDLVRNVGADFQEMRERLEAELARGEIGAMEFAFRMRDEVNAAVSTILINFERMGVDIDAVWEEVRRLTFGSTREMQEAMENMSEEGRAAFEFLSDQIQSQYDEMVQAGNNAAREINGAFRQLGDDISNVFDRAGIDASELASDLQEQFSQTQNAASQEFENMQRLFEIAFRTGSDEAFEMAERSRAEFVRLINAADRQLDQMLKQVIETYGAGSDEARLFRIFANDEMQRIRDQYQGFLGDIEGNFDGTFDEIFRVVEEADLGGPIMFFNRQVNEVTNNIANRFRSATNSIRGQLSNFRWDAHTTTSSVNRNFSGLGSTLSSRIRSAVFSAENSFSRLRNAASWTKHRVVSEFSQIKSNLTSSINVNLSTSSVSSFASGGLVFGETIARVGEYAGAATNPEVIAPLSDLQNMLKGTLSSVGGGGSMSQVIVVNLDGREIARTAAENLPEFLEVQNLR